MTFHPHYQFYLHYFYEQNAVCNVKKGHNALFSSYLLK